MDSLRDNHTKYDLSFHFIEAESPLFRESSCCFCRPPPPAQYRYILLLLLYITNVHWGTAPFSHTQFDK